MGACKLCASWPAWEAVQAAEQRVFACCLQSKLLLQWSNIMYVSCQSKIHAEYKPHGLLCHLISAAVQWYKFLEQEKDQPDISRHSIRRSTLSAVKVVAGCMSNAVAAVVSKVKSRL